MKHAAIFTSFARATSKAALFLFAVAMLAGAAEPARGQSSLDGFDPNANGPILVAVIQPDGKALIGGNFTQLSPNGGPLIKRNRIARLNPDGTVDIAFNPTADNSVRAIVVQADNKIVIGGNFTTLSPNGGAEVTRNRIARLNADGTVDPAFNPSANGSIRTISLHPGGRILAGGTFTEIGGAARINIARLNSSGAVDSFNPEPNGTVNAIAVDTSGILVGGAFTKIGGVTRNNIARLDGSGAAVSFNPSANNSVFSIVPQADGKILVGGIFTQIGGAARPRIARVDLATGVADSFDPRANGDVYTIAVQADGRILLGGLFNTIRGATRTAIARVEPANGFPDSFQPSMNSQVFSIAVQPDGKCVVGGDFTSSNGQTRNRIARMEIDGRLDQTLFPTLSGGHVNALAVQTDGKILIGGIIGGVSDSYQNILRLNTDSTRDTALNAEAGVLSIAVQADGNLLMGGFFNSDSGADSIGGQPRNYIARLEATTGLADSFNPNADSLVTTIGVQADGKILVGGSFRQIGGVARKNIARLDPATGLADSFNPDANAPIRSFVVQPDGKILVSGDFTRISGVLRNKIARLDPVTGAADAFNPNADSSVQCIAVQADGKVLASGNFTTIAGANRRRFVRLNSNGTLDTVFNPSANDEVTSILIQSDGKILVSGYFTNIGGAPRNRIARLDPTTGVADSFNPNASGPVLGIALQADGKILACGNFFNIGAFSSALLARLSNDTAALQNLTVMPTTITWARGGSSPQLTRATFESSPDNVNFTFLGHGTPSGSNWVLTGLNLPAGQNTIIRARGFYRSGDNNGSESAVGSRRNAFFPSPGNFVIGDRNAVVGQRVVFWGARWANWNSLSSGPAPASFKGFANSPSTNPPACGGTWKSDPGNSAAPPSVAPGNINVIVASSITKSGAVISGNIPTMAVVAPDPGYDSNPDHVGTGTVVSVSCGQP